LTDSEEETIVLAAGPNQPLVAEARLGQSCLEKYDKIVAIPPKLTTESAKPSTKQPVEKQKELQFFKALSKDNVKESITPYRFDILA